MVAIETETVDNAITAGLPSTVASLPSHYVSAQVSTTDDEQLSATSFLNTLTQQQVRNCNQREKCEMTGNPTQDLLHSKRVPYH